MLILYRIIYKNTNTYAQRHVSSGYLLKSDSKDPKCLLILSIQLYGSIGKKTSTLGCTGHSGIPKTDPIFVLPNWKASRPTTVLEC